MCWRNLSFNKKKEKKKRRKEEDKGRKRESVCDIPYEQFSSVIYFRVLFDINIVFSEVKTRHMIGDDISLSWRYIFLLRARAYYRAYLPLFLLRPQPSSRTIRDLIKRFLRFAANLFDRSSTEICAMSYFPLFLPALLFYQIKSYTNETNWTSLLRTIASKCYFAQRNLSVKNEVQMFKMWFAFDVGWQDVSVFERYYSHCVIIEINNIVTHAVS